MGALQGSLVEMVLAAKGHGAQSKEKLQEVVEGVRDVFNKDPAHPNEFDRDEFEEFLRFLNVDEKEKASDEFQEADANHDGKLDDEELKHAVKHAIEEKQKEFLPTDWEVLEWESEL